MNCNVNLPFRRWRGWAKEALIKSAIHARYTLSLTAWCLRHNSNGNFRVCSSFHSGDDTRALSVHHSSSSPTIRFSSWRQNVHIARRENWVKCFIHILHEFLITARAAFAWRFAEGVVREYFSPKKKKHKTLHDDDSRRLEKGVSRLPNKISEISAPSQGGWGGCELFH